MEDMTSKGRYSSLVAENPEAEYYDDEEAFKSRGYNIKVSQKERQVKILK